MLQLTKILLVNKYNSHVTFGITKTVEIVKYFTNHGFSFFNGNTHFELLHNHNPHVSIKWIFMMWIFQLINDKEK